MLSQQIARVLGHSTTRKASDLLYPNGLSFVRSEQASPLFQPGTEETAMVRNGSCGYRAGLGNVPRLGHGRNREESASVGDVSRESLRVRLGRVCST